MKTQDFETVEEFWEHLSPYGSFASQLVLPYLFRGQSDSEWTLTPKVYRSDILSRYKAGMIGVLRDHPGQTAFELMLLNGFLQHCDRQGLRIPEDGLEFRDFMDFNRAMRVHGIDNRAWPQPRYHTLMALAQHHGVPTRLLDWSDSFLVACYFAVAGVLEDPKPGTRMAIFALTNDPFGVGEAYKHIRVPGATSANIAAQQGSFVLVNNTGSRGEDFSVDVSLDDLVTAPQELYKFTLPVHQAPKVLQLCKRFGVSASTIFPGYDGAARATLDDNLASSFQVRLVEKSAMSRLCIA